MNSENTSKVLESIKDLLTGDQLSEMGFYDAEPLITRAVNSHEALVELAEYVRSGDLNLEVNQEWAKYLAQKAISAEAGS